MFSSLYSWIISLTDNHELTMELRLFRLSINKDIESSQDSQVEIPLEIENKYSLLFLFRKIKQCLRIGSKRNNSWPFQLIFILSTLFLILVLYSYRFLGSESTTCDPGPPINPRYIKIDGFDANHSRLSKKYDLFLYREDTEEDIIPKGIPVVFIPGHAGSYQQGRSLAAEAVKTYHEIYENDKIKLRNPFAQNLDFFLADFKNDFSAFHGRTILDQAEYLNDAIKFILTLYNNDANKPAILPQSVILIGHSMGGLVCRVLMTTSNYIPGSVNTIITLSSPHAIPPVTFDWDTINIYEKCNKYWRDSFSSSMLDNPLSNLSLISIAGGKPDTTLPSDYTSLISLMPETNGLTVFSTGIPKVWTPIDHLAVVWCNQLRHAIVTALLETVDRRSPSKTKNLTERMSMFKKIFLNVVDKEMNNDTLDTFLQIEDGSNYIPAKDHLIMKGYSSSQNINLIKIPQTSQTDNKLTILSNVNFQENDSLKVLICNQTDSQSIPVHLTHIRTTSGETKVIERNQFDSAQDTRNLVCQNLREFTMLAPKSSMDSLQLIHTSPNDDTNFGILDFNVNDIKSFDYVAIVGALAEKSDRFLLGEISPLSRNSIVIKENIWSLLRGVKLSIPSKSINTDIKIDSSKSNLFVYDVEIAHNSSCSSSSLFSPFARQYINSLHESAYHINLGKYPERRISFDGMPPFVPYSKSTDNSLHFQVFTDSLTCEESKLTFSIKLNIFSSLGLLVLRYRLVLVSFPLLVVLLVFLIQINTYSTKRNFISYEEGLSILCNRYLPIILITLSLTSWLVSIDLIKHFLSLLDVASSESFRDVYKLGSKYSVNKYFLGLEDIGPLWLLGPFFFFVSITVSTIIYFVIIILLKLFSRLLLTLLRLFPKGTQILQFNPGPTSALKTTTALVALSMLLVIWVPFQVIFVIEFFIIAITCVRLYTIAQDKEGNYHIPLFRSEESTYVKLEHSLHFMISFLMIMIWVLFLNIPITVVWLQNLSLHWYTSFSILENILSIAPIMLLVNITAINGTLSTKPTDTQLKILGLIVIYMGFYVLIYGIQHTFWIHYIFETLCFWLFIIEFGHEYLQERAVN